MDVRVGPKNWCFSTAVLEKTLESPLDCKEIKPVNPKKSQSWPWLFMGRTDAETETPRLWPPCVKSQLIGKNLDAGKDWGQKEKEATEDWMVGWYHWLSGHEFEQTSRDGEGQRSLSCCSSQGHKESDMTEWLNNTNNIVFILQMRTLQLREAQKLSQNHTFNTWKSVCFNLPGFLNK